MRSVENGTFSMPSGDSAAAAVFCTLIACEMNLPLIYFVLPLVMAGRVYYHCHWWGDTIAGAVIGVAWAILFVVYFDKFVPFFAWVAGDNVFIKQTSTT